MAITSVTAGNIIDPAWGNSVATAINAHEDAWTSYTPTPTGFTVGAGTITGKYNAIGKTIHYRGQVVFGAGAGITGDFVVSVPVTAVTAEAACGTLDMLDNGTGYEVGTVLIVSSTTVELHHARGLGSNAGRVGGTNPFTWVPGDSFRWNITYQAA